MLFVVMISFNAAAYEFAEDWSWSDTAWQGAVITLKVIDWGQTRHIAKNPDRFYEMNPVLGEHPSVDQVDLFFVTSLTVHTAVALALPPKAKAFGYDINPRRIWQAVQITGSMSCVVHNASVGIRIDF